MEPRVITALFFGRPAKRPYIFLLKKKKKKLSLIRPNFFWPIGDRINGFPLYTSDRYCQPNILSRYAFDPRL